MHRALGMHDIAVQQMKSVDQNQHSYKKLTDTYKNLVDNISGIENISTARLRPSFELPDNINQAISTDPQYLFAPTYQDNHLEFTEKRLEAKSKSNLATASISTIASNKTNNFKSNNNQNKFFELIAKSVHKIVERDLFPESISSLKIRDFVDQSMRQMGEYGTGAYFGLRDSADRSFSEYARHVWAQQDRASLVTMQLMQKDRAYEQDIKNRLEGITNILVAS